MKQDAKILLAKISYAMGDYLAAHKILQEMNLESISLQNMSIRKLQLIGEGFAIKGKQAVKMIHIICHHFFIGHIVYRL